MSGLQWRKATIADRLRKQDREDNLKRARQHWKTLRAIAKARSQGRKKKPL